MKKNISQQSAAEKYREIWPYVGGKVTKFVNRSRFFPWLHFEISDLFMWSFDNFAILIRDQLPNFAIFSWSFDEFWDFSPISFKIFFFPRDYCRDSRLFPTNSRYSISLGWKFDEIRHFRDSLTKLSFLQSLDEFRDFFQWDILMTFAIFLPRPFDEFCDHFP